MEKIGEIPPGYFFIREKIPLFHVIFPVKFHANYAEDEEGNADDESEIPNAFHHFSTSDNKILQSGPRFGHSEDSKLDGGKKWG